MWSCSSSDLFFPVLFATRKLGMHRISRQTDFRPDNPTFLYIRYPAGYQIALPDVRPAGYPVKTVWCIPTVNIKLLINDALSVANSWQRFSARSTEKFGR
jgi:hypothetical protein